MLGAAHSIALIYRLYYKCIKTNLNVHALVKIPKDKTLFIQGNTSETNIEVPKTICWDEITLLDNWVTINENYIHPHQTDSNDVQQIQQHDDGSVLIRFNCPTYSQYSRHSTSSILTDDDEIFSTPLFICKD
ncbi:hypothetical protein ACSBR1_015044 [Camellia fascicularis]